MKNIKLIAGRNCPYREEGEEFMANSSEAKALVALGRATRAEESYLTRDMPAAATQTKKTDKPARDVKISAAARELAESNNIDLASITGTGKNGAITVSDVKAAIK